MTECNFLSWTIKDIVNSLLFSLGSPTSTVEGLLPCNKDTQAVQWRSPHGEDLRLLAISQRGGFKRCPQIL